MSDIVERLSGFQPRVRKMTVYTDADTGEEVGFRDPLMLEAAAEITRLRALVLAAQIARDGLSWAQLHLREAGMSSVSVDEGLATIEIALAALKGDTHG